MVPCKGGKVCGGRKSGGINVRLRALPLSLSSSKSTIEVINNKPNRNKDG